MDKRPPPRPALIVHAGAWDVPAAERPAHRDACLRAARAGWSLLEAGASAIDAVLAAVVTLEDDPAVNAGRGSVLCREGWPECDAAIMDGTTLDVGAVTGVRDVRNPVRLAAALLREEEVLLAGDGASAFAREKGVETCAPAELIVEREVARLEAWRRHATPSGPPSPPDTVGAVAVDQVGRIVAASSTGGRVGKRSGRVGDTPLAGAGLWADHLVAGAAATGWGEHVVRVGLARRAVELARDHAAQDACWLAIRELQDRVHGQGGIVLIGRDGSIGFAHGTPAMPVAFMDGEMGEPFVGGVGRP